MLNVCVIVNKFVLFVDYINECKVDLCVIIEIWLLDNDFVVCYEIILFCYKLFYCFRSDCRGGGMVFLFRENINVCKFEFGLRYFFEFFEYFVCIGFLCI